MQVQEENQKIPDQRIMMGKYQAHYRQNEAGFHCRYMVFLKGQILPNKKFLFTWTFCCYNCIVSETSIILIPSTVFPDFCSPWQLLSAWLIIKLTSPLHLHLRMLSTISPYFCLYGGDEHNAKHLTITFQWVEMC